MVPKSVTIDWTLREGARPKIRVIVKRILDKYGYPSVLQAEAWGRLVQVLSDGRRPTLQLIQPKSRPLRAGTAFGG